MHRTWSAGHRPQWTVHSDSSGRLQPPMAKSASALTRAKSASALRPRSQVPPPREEFIDTLLADQILDLLRRGDKETVLACEQAGVDAYMLEPLPSDSFGEGSAEVLKMRDANHKKRRAALARIVQQRVKHLQSEARRSDMQASRSSLRRYKTADSHGLLEHIGTHTSSAVNLANGLTSSWIQGVTSECELAPASEADSAPAIAKAAIWLWQLLSPLPSPSPACIRRPHPWHV